jgi:predicted outer membrane protein
MKKKIVTIEDYMIGKSELELERVTDLLHTVRGEGDYFKEKATAKLLAYHEHERNLILLYVEMRQSYPDIARALEEQKPYLLTLWQQAEEEWSQP